MGAVQKWLPGYQPNGRINLLLFPFAGAQANAFSAWRGHGLKQKIQMCPVALPGRGARFCEPAYDSIPLLVRDFLAEIGTAFFREPYAVFGHSLGAAVAYELTHQIGARGYRKPLTLFLSGRASPEKIRTRSFSHLSDEELKEELRAMGGTGSEILENHDLMALLLPTMRADFKMADDISVETKPVLDVPIHCFSGMQDEYCSPDYMEAWEAHTVGGFQLTAYSGGHFFINQHFPDIVSCIAGDLRQFACVT